MGDVEFSVLELVCMEQEESPDHQGVFYCNVYIICVSCSLVTDTIAVIYSYIYVLQCCKSQFT